MNNKKALSKLLIALIIIIPIVIIVGIALTGVKKNDVPKIGFVITGTINDTGWNGAHYKGISYACDKLGAKLLVEENIPEDTAMCTAAIERLIDKGASMIVLSSYSYPDKAAEIIKKYPDVAFYGSASEFTFDNFTSYFGRMYQIRYLSGILAGMKTETGNIGYVAAMPNIEVIRGINAFTLGVKQVNPDATVNVIWTDSWDNEEQETVAAEKLINNKAVDLITYHQNQAFVARVADDAGIYSIGYNETVSGLSDKHLTAAIWNWKKMYYKIIREYMLGNANSVKRHWLGIDTGAVELSDYSSLVTEDEKKAIDTKINELLSGKQIFSGEIYDNEGNLRCSPGESISDEILLEEMNWFVDGVIIYE
ncbi:MAG: BMP family ABC transporter substrate-binding protein [Lachnospiraceae bacterium]|nr:BMP family ABC transporter substrate-binding protein [Lachnospiraceae bacterium]